MNENTQKFAKYIQNEYMSYWTKVDTDEKGVRDCGWQLAQEWNDLANDPESQDVGCEVLSFEEIELAIQHATEQVAKIFQED